MNEFTEKMKADHDEALRINAEMTAKAQSEVSTLRIALAKIESFADSWIKQYNADTRSLIPIDNVINKFITVSSTCSAAVSEPTAPTTPLTYVTVGGEIYAGNIIETEEKYPEGWVTIEVINVDPSAGRMAVTGPLAGYAPTTPPETVGEIS